MRATYSTPDKKKLLRRLHRCWSATARLTDGFQMLGDVRPGPGWRARDDGRYQNPVSMEELRRINADYVRGQPPVRLAARAGYVGDPCACEFRQWE